MKARLCFAAALLAAAAIPGSALAQGSAAPTLITPPELASMAAEAERYPLFREELQRTRADVDAAMRAPINVPLPKDPGGGLTHEQHKRNYKIIHGAGMLYRITRERS